MLRRALPLYLLLTAVFCWPLFEAPTGVGILDWDQHFFLYAAVAKSLFAFHQWPFWNPYYCGGNMLWQNPEVAVLSPAYLLALVMPLQLAMKFNIALHYLAGLLGMHLLLRRSFAVTSWPLVTFLASTFALGGGLAMHVGVGHATFLTFMYLPWLLHFTIQACSAATARAALSPALAGGACIALSAYNGGIYPVVMTGFALGVFGLVASLVRRDWRPMAFVMLVGIAGGTYAAPKLLPIGAALVDSRLLDARPDLREPDSLTWGELKTSFVDPTRPADWVGWFEYGNYVGLVAGLLFLATMLYWLSTKPTRERWLGVSLSVAAVLLLLLTRGTFSDYAPYTLLRELPIFSSLRKPSRYSMIFVLFAASAAAEALRVALKGQSLSPALRRIGAIVLVLATADLVWHNRAEFDGAMAQPPTDLDLQLTSRTPEPTFDTVSNGYGSNFAMMSGIATNRDIVRCHILLAPHKSVTPERNVIWADPGVRLSPIAFTPNRMSVTASTSASARVFLNQNYITGWHATAGKFGIDPATGQGMTTLPAGFSGTVTFYYRPPGLITGVIIFLFGLTGTVIRQKAKSRRHKQS